MGKHIILIGLMGAGKTTVGKMLAKSFECPFYDSDHEIEKKTGVSIPHIFEVEGEEGFRKRESQIIEELCLLPAPVILATGGGAVIKPENRVLMQQYGTVIYLRATVHDLWLRTRNDRNRPLLQQGNARQTLEKLYRQRSPMYEATAHHVVNTGSAPANHIVRTIEDIISAQTSSE